MSINGAGQARWAFDISKWRPAITDLRTATRCVQPEEKARLSKYVFLDDFNASLVGRLMMRKFVRDTTAMDYDRIKFSRDVRGKPYLLVDQSEVSDVMIDFNVSHQGDYVVLAGMVQPKSETRPKIGVDVMKIEYSGGKPLSEFFRLMNRNFSDREWEFIKKQPGDREQTQAFMRHWCLKESYVKNVGVGITVDLKNISFEIKTDGLRSDAVVTDTRLEVQGDLMEDWKFEESLIGNDHCVAVSLLDGQLNEDVGAKNVFELIKFNTLLDGSVPLLPIDENYCENILQKTYK